MNDKITYGITDSEPIFYKDAFVLYKDMIADALAANKINPNVVQIVNNELINVNRAPLIVIRRVDSPQPPAINSVNEKILDIGGTKVVRGSNSYSLNMAFFSYGNSYLEAERLSSIIQKRLIVTSVNKLRKMSNGKVLGHMLLGWSGTDYVKSDSKLMSNRIDIRIETVLEYSVEL